MKNLKKQYKDVSSVPIKMRARDLEPGRIQIYLEDPRIDIGVLIKRSETDWDVEGEPEQHYQHESDALGILLQRTSSLLKTALEEYHNENQEN
jgi:hypothetical protein